MTISSRAISGQQLWTTIKAEMMIPYFSHFSVQYNITIETDTDKSEESCDTSSSMRQSSTSEGEDSETRNG